MKTYPSCSEFTKTRFQGGSEAVTEEDSVLAVEAVEESPLDVFHEECGVFGVYRHPEAANLAYLGLYAQQHRGQESAGIVSSNGKSIPADSCPRCCCANRSRRESSRPTASRSF